MFTFCAAARQNEIDRRFAGPPAPFLDFGHPLASATSAVLMVMALMISSIRRSSSRIYSTSTAPGGGGQKTNEIGGGNHGLAKRDLPIF